MTEPRDTNPKTSFGRMKPSPRLVPPVAVLHEAAAFEDGAAKYGPYNWREHSVSASTYVDAALRHLYAWADGEDIAADSGVHHLGHARACLAVLLDAMECGVLIDDRPKPGAASTVIERLRAAKAARGGG